MDKRHELIDHVIQKPTNLKARQAFADHLNSINDSWGQLTGIQLALRTAKKFSGDWVRLKVREAELAAQLNATSFESLGDHQSLPCFHADRPSFHPASIPFGATWQLRNGFFDSVFIRGQGFVDQSELLFASLPLCELSIGMIWNPEDFDRETREFYEHDQLADLDSVLSCPQLAQLDSLCLSAPLLSSESASRVIEMRQLTHVKQLALVLRNAEPGSIINALRDANQFQSLEELSISWEDDQDGALQEDESDANAAAAQLAHVTSKNNLKRLSLRGAGLGPTGLRTLLESPLPNQISELEFSGNPIGSDGARLIADAEVSCDLSELNLDYCNIGPNGIHALAHSPRFRKLRKLSLNGNADIERQIYGETLNDSDPGWIESAKALAASPAFPSLESLDLSNCNVGDRAFVSIIESAAFPNLRVLRAHHNELTDVSLQRLAESRTLEHLVMLDIGRNKFTDTGLRHLVMSPKARNLASLNVRNTNLTVNSAIAISRSPYLSNLIELQLWTGRSPTGSTDGDLITRDRVDALTSSRNLTSLVRLPLPSNLDRGLVEILQARWNGRLQTNIYHSELGWKPICS